MNLLYSAFAASLMLVASSCNYKTHQEDSAPSAVQERVLDTTVFSAGFRGDKKEEQQPEKEKSVVSVNQDWDKKIIKNAVLSIETDEYQQYNKAIHEIVKQLEGYIAKEEENASDYKIENSLTIRVPAARFEEIMNNLSFREGKMREKRITSQDVTGEVIDTRTRLEAKKRVRLRYLDMLQKAKNMEEILLVEKEINDLQEQIEAADGRVNYLNHSAAYSTIQLTFFQVLNPAASDAYHPGFGRRMLAALNDGFSWMGELLIIFMTLWPVWLITALTLLIFRRWRKLSRPLK